MFVKDLKLFSLFVFIAWVNFAIIITMFEQNFVAYKVLHTLIHMGTSAILDQDNMDSIVLFLKWGKLRLREQKINSGLFMITSVNIWMRSAELFPALGITKMMFYKWKWKSRSVVSDSATLWNRPWNSPGQNTGVGCHSLLQGIVPTQGSNPGLLNCRRILYQLNYQGSPVLEVDSRNFVDDSRRRIHKGLWKEKAMSLITVNGDCGDKTLFGIIVRTRL